MNRQPAGQRNAQPVLAGGARAPQIPGAQARVPPVATPPTVAANPPARNALPLQGGPQNANRPANPVTEPNRGLAPGRRVLDPNVVRGVPAPPPQAPAANGDFIKAQPAGRRHLDPNLVNGGPAANIGDKITPDMTTHQRYLIGQADAGYQGARKAGEIPVGTDRRGIWMWTEIADGHLHKVIPSNTSGPKLGEGFLVGKDFQEKDIIGMSGIANRAWTFIDPSRAVFAISFTKGSVLPAIRSDLPFKQGSFEQFRSAARKQGVTIVNKQGQNDNYWFEFDFNKGPVFQLTDGNWPWSFFRFRITIDSDPDKCFPKYKLWHLRMVNDPTPLGIQDPKMNGFDYAKALATAQADQMWQQSHPDNDNYIETTG